MSNFNRTLISSAILALSLGVVHAAPTLEGNGTLNVNGTGTNELGLAISGNSSCPASASPSGIAVGGLATAGINGVAIGAQATNANADGVMANGATAVGRGAKATVDTGIALGGHSVADRARGTFGYDSEGNALTEAVSFSDVGDKKGRVWTSNDGVMSIGVDGPDGVSRQLTGLAAGSQDNDAVNVAQLKSLKAYSDATFSTASNTIFGEGASNVITPAVVGADGNVTTGAKTATNAAILGNNATVKAHNGAAFGYNAQVMEVAEGTALAGNVAIGANSIATMDGRNATVQFKPDGATGGAWASEGLVSFGGSYQGNDASGKAPGEAGYDPATGTVNFNRQLTGVAAGSEDNDAVNVAQLREVNDQVTKLTTGQTAISKIDLLANPDDPTSGGIGLRFEAATQPGGSAEGMAAQAEGGEIGRLAYTDIDGTKRQVATMSDGFTISAGSSSSAAREGEAAPVKVDLNKGISFLTDSEYLSTNVAADGNGGAVVTFNTTQALKDALANAGGSTGGNTGGDSGSSGNTGGSGWTPSQAQLAAMNGNFANGITVAPGEGNQAIQIKQGNVDMGGNRIQNVGNPINDGDAANKAYVDSTSRSLRNKINDVDKDLRAGVAMAMAVGGLPQAYMPGKSIVGVSAGTYHGQGGFALGLSHATDNRQWVFKGAASVDTRGNFGGQLSAGYQF